MSDDLDVLCLGEALWDLVTPPGRSFADAPTLGLVPGGAAVNVALGLARLGHATGLAATVGDDALGHALLARLSSRGVATSFATRSPRRTGLCFVERGPGDRLRAVSYRPDEDAAVQVPRSWRARVLFVTGVLPSEAQAEGFAAAARAARRRRARVVVDLNARPRLWKGKRGAPFLGWLREAHVVKGSEEDLAVLGVDEAMLRDGDARRVVVVTAGPRPARALGPFGTIELPVRAPSSGTALGAGDAFMAGVLDALLREDGSDASFWRRALRRGHALAKARVRTSA